MPDRRFVKAYDRLVLGEASTARIWTALERALPSGEEKHPVKKMKNPIHTVLVAAVITALLIVSAYAVSSAARSVGTYPMPEDGRYESFSALAEVERKAGYPIRAVESFANGYRFKEMELRGEARFDEEFRPVEEYYGVMISYTKSGAKALDLFLTPVSETAEDVEAPLPTEVRRVGSTELRCSVDRYRFVPEDYEKTEADLAAEAAGHFYISFGAERTEERSIASVSYTREGVEYMLLDTAADADSLDMLCKMAAELLERG